MRAPGSYAVRFEWGPAGAAALAPSSSCLVIVDVLSFSTSVTVAAEAGTRVYPWWGSEDEDAAGFAREHRAQLAGGRRSGVPWSLSPAALRRAPFTPRLVLPSPNGSAICAAAVAGEAAVIAGCLRNAAAVGRFLREREAPGPVTVIAAGERWPDGSLRPALEDLLGAGAVLAAVAGALSSGALSSGALSSGALSSGALSSGALSSGALSPEAEAARACYGATADVAAAVAGSASGRELTEGGFGDDVAIAVVIDSCDLVPILADGAFIAASGR
jgi:2-phosphosulfolactate phosphatase